MVHTELLSCFLRETQLVYFRGLIIKKKIVLAKKKKLNDTEQDDPEC